MLVVKQYICIIFVMQHAEVTHHFLSMCTGMVKLVSVLEDMVCTVIYLVAKYIKRWWCISKSTKSQVDDLFK